MRPSSLLGVLLDFLDEHEAATTRPADIGLSRFFQARRYLGSRDRRFIGDGAFAWFRHGRRGEVRWGLWTARRGLRLPEEGRVRRLGPLLVLAAEERFPWGREQLVEAARTFATAAGGGWIDAVERCALEEFPGEEDWPRDPLERLAAECSVPQWVADRLVRLHGRERARALGLALLEPAPVDLRVRLSRVEREVARHELEESCRVEVEATPWSPSGLRLRSRLDLKRFVKLHPGWLEVQDEGSQIAAMACAPRPEETIIDACAGGGGKTLALADLTGGRGKFHCCDINTSKLAELRRRAEPLAIESLTVHQISPEGELPSSLPRRADLVLVDAPCTGLGALRRAPDLKLRHGAEDAAEFGRRQLGILERFAPRVRPGGRLVYVTCSVIPDENDDVVRAFLEAHPDFVTSRPAVAARLPAVAVSPEGWLRLDPLATGTDGFLVACLARRGDGETAAREVETVAGAPPNGA